MAGRGPGPEQPLSADWQFDAPTEVTLQAAPNPFGSSLALSLTLPNADTAVVVMTDALGRTAHRQCLSQMVAGTSQVVLTGIESLSTGVYLLRVSVASSMHALKAAKQ